MLGRVGLNANIQGLMVAVGTVASLVACSGGSIALAAAGLEPQNFLVSELPAGEEPSVGLPLRPVAAVEESSLWPELVLPGDRQVLIQAINHSLTYLATPKAELDYQDYLVPGITRDRVWRSLQRLRQLVATSPNNQAFQAALRQEFVLYESVGADGEGTVAYTGYFEPQYRASAVPNAEYRYPLYRRPPGLESWPQPHPTRLELEGVDGLAGGQGDLAGLELVWLASRLEAFLVQVQGSAKLQLTDGTVMSVGYAGRTEYPYTSIGRALVEDGKIDLDSLSLPNLLAYFESHPEELDRYLPQNERFIFFREGDGGPPSGSLSVPVTAGYSIATDKSLMPPGAIAAIQLTLPQQTPQGDWVSQPTTRLVLDQDTGGAIQGPGRVDLYVGPGRHAGEVAGRINTSGRLYYLLLRP
ncbi:MltA domain-containing protein [Leptolyngbya sp. CCNP1308]|uniref:murein transglycosylase A n=1 Tax=Leptolyngbya sp. CCNP1308 TaxID=3110255 RepID=UPI002B20B7CA|nr:MltA domain-containing protein [Leptolyngbya sp. CCNP1308]MEA5447169.1 MltA domain-containing protein [Leptolyngbya sp. CCNP1308]